MSGTILSTRMMRRVALVLWCSALLPALLTVALRGAASAIVLAVVLIAPFVCAALGSLYLARRYEPALRALRFALQSFPEHQPETRACAASDEPAALLDLAARRGAQLRQRLQSLEACAEIDQLLICSSGLEQILEALLARVQSVMHCHGVSITLRDADAPGRGRVYVSVAGLAQLPVSRVALDADMLARLSAEPSGLTIARCEEGRHSFLKPLSETGAELFWVWPVFVAERVEAILTVGYRGVPAADPQLGEQGGEFAARLAVALSKRAHDEELYRRAHFDPLTSLPNRALFLERLSQELAAAAAGAREGALMYIDLDHFKRVNDGFGHAAGDQLLAVVAQRLRGCVKEGDTVARLGGDEFTIILRNVASETAVRAVAERVIESLQQPIHCSGRDHRIGASVGVTLFPHDSAQLEELVRNADSAMYRAKDLGRGRVMLYDGSMRSKVPASTTGLHRALRRREFSLFYQPQFALADGSLVGVEALLRWHSPREGVREPNQFVPAAEESGVIVDIGGWVLDAACAQLAAWREEQVNPPRVSVNVWAQQLRVADFAKMVRRALDKHSLPAELLELEITEGVLEDRDAAAALARLAQWGVHLALDDFGTGYSALTHLSQHPLGGVKLERALLAEVPENAGGATLVETVIVMAHALGKRVVAKGIERIEQLDFLRERGCDAAQGFYLARPLPAAEMTELLQSRALALRGVPQIRAAG